jgi:hypothetical protein
LQGFKKELYMRKDLKVRFLDEANVQQSALFAVIDAKKQNAEHASLYTQAEHALADDFLTRAQGAFIRSKCYKNNRQNFISIKIAKPTAADKLSKEVEELDKYAQQLGAVKKLRGDAIIYEVVQRA